MRSLVQLDGKLWDRCAFSPWSWYPAVDYLYRSYAQFRTATGLAFLSMLVGVSGYEYIRGIVFEPRHINFNEVDQKGNQFGEIFNPFKRYNFYLEYLS